MVERNLRPASHSNSHWLCFLERTCGSGSRPNGDSQQSSWITAPRCGAAIPYRHRSTVCDTVTNTGASHAATQPDANGHRYPEPVANIDAHPKPHADSYTHAAPTHPG
jgi:hypothetical protein